MLLLRDSRSQLHRRRARRNRREQLRRHGPREIVRGRNVPGRTSSSAFRTAETRSPIRNHSVSGSVWKGPKHAVAVKGLGNLGSRSGARMLPEAKDLDTCAVANANFGDGANIQMAMALIKWSAHITAEAVVS